VFVGAGILLMLATPLLPELYRCGQCGTARRGQP
jgi:hypothetical protein